MTRFVRVLIVGLAAGLFLSACGGDDPTIGTADLTVEDADGTPEDAPAGTTGTADDGAEAGMVLTAELTGAAERPDPGDEDGTGKATITIETTTNEICFQLSVDGIGDATAAHIHRGDAATAGDIVVELVAPVSGSSEGCSAVEADLANDIAANPGSYYVNVHNAEFPKGAVRGQLSAS